MRNQDHNIDVSEQVEEAKKAKEAKEAIEVQLGTAGKPVKIGRLKKLLSFLHVNLKRTKHDIHHKPTYQSRQVSARALDDIVLINHLDAITVELDHLIDADTHGQVLPVTKGVQNPKNPKNAKSLKNKRLGDVGQFLIFNSFIDSDNALLEQKEQKEQTQKNTQKSQKLKVLYVLVAEDISEADYSALLLKLEILKKGYLFQVMNKARMSLIKSIYKQYIDKKKIHENRVEKSQWEYHFNQILEKAIRLNSSDIHITAKDETATVMVRVHGDLQEIDRYTYSDMLRLISSAYNQLASIDSKDQSYSPTQTHETAIHRVINRQTYNLRFISKPIYPSGSFDVTMRLIDEDFYRNMKDIGYLDSQINTLVDAMAQPNGMVILAGRVGSGKSATIHSLSTRYIRVKPGYV